jgi:hypothetical protein
MPQWPTEDDEPAPRARVLGRRFWIPGDHQRVTPCIRPHSHKTRQRLNPAAKLGHSEVSSSSGQPGWRLHPVGIGLVDRITPLVATLGPVVRIELERVEALELLGMTLAHLNDAEVFAATSAMDKYRGGEEGEAGSALVVVGLSAERAAKEVGIRDDMIRVAHRAGASIRQLADASGRGRKTVSQDDK